MSTESVVPARAMKPVLEGMRSELRDKLGIEPRSQHETCADFVDASSRAVLSQLEGLSNQRASHMLRRVNCALQRIKSGDYGICIDCGDPIPLKRLEARPTTKRCRECQQEADKTAPNGGKVLINPWRG